MDERPHPGLAIDEGLDTQRVMVHVEWAGRVILAGVVVASMLGLLGQSGPLNRRDLRSDTVAMSHDRFARIEALTEIRVSSETGNALARIVISDSYLDHVRLEKVQPEPKAVVLVDGGTAFDFGTESDGASSVRFFVEPPHPGSLAGTVSVGEQRFSISQLVYP